jgi:hypothetical protein
VVGGSGGCDGFVAADNTNCIEDAPTATVRAFVLRAKLGEVGTWNEYASVKIGTNARRTRWNEVSGRGDCGLLKEI